MRLKEAPMEVRMIALFAAVGLAAYGFLLLSFIGQKFQQICHMLKSPAGSETFILGFYVLLAAAGTAISIIHLWPANPPRK